MNKQAYDAGYEAVMKQAGLITKGDLASMSKEDGMAAVKSYMNKHPYKGKLRGLDMQKYALSPALVTRTGPKILNRILDSAGKVTGSARRPLMNRLSRVGSNVERAGLRSNNAGLIDIGDAAKTRSTTSLSQMLGRT